jgi:hypothetical protein
MESEYRQDKGEYKFSNKQDPKAAVVSFFGGVAEFLLLLALLVLSVYTKGNNAVWTGAVGITIMMLSGFGMYYSSKCFSMEEIRYQYPIAGIVMNGLVFCSCFILFFIGLQI